MIQLIFVALLLVIFINLIISDMDYFNPGVIFNTMFALYAFMCCIVDSITGLEINNPMTFVVIVGGGVFFTIINWLSSQVIRGKSYDEGTQIINLNKAWIIAFLVIELVVILAMYKYVNDFAGVYGVDGSFSEKLSFYDTITKFNSDYKLRMPSYVSVGNLLGRVLCYIALYVLINNFVEKKYIQYSLIAIIAIYFIGSLMGGRTEALRIVTAAVALWYIMFKRKHGWRKADLKIIFRLFASAVGVVVLFSWMRSFLGRTTYDPIKVVFGYIGAPLKNLDTFLTFPTKSIDGVWGAMTFTKFINWLGMKLDIPEWIYVSDQPFLYYKTFRMGNVYTMYYNFIYDFGYIGCALLTSIIAFYYCFTYRKIKNMKSDKSKINFKVIMYAYLFNDLIMLPLSSRFYETIVNINYFRIFIIFTALIFVINNLRISGMKVYFVRKRGY